MFAPLRLSYCVMDFIFSCVLGVFLEFRLNDVKKILVILTHVMRWFDMMKFSI